MTRSWIRGLGAALWLLSASALAQTAGSDSLGALREEVIRARQQTPQAFTRLEEAIGRVTLLDSRKRGTLASVSPLFTQLGPEALWPMVERIAFDASLDQPAWASAQLALKVGLVEATGALRDARLLPLWKDLLEGPEERRPVRRVAAVALAKLDSPEAAALLITLSHQEGSRGWLVREAMGQCRRLVVAQALAEALGTRPAATEARRLAQALGDVGSAWAWKTSQARARAEEGEVRRVAAQALLGAWLAYEGDVRLALTNALLRVDAPETQALIDAAQTRQSGSGAAALASLAERLRNNPLR
ncbi:hypothetical protein LZ198_36315 [Myxococcus sp. K15C18031901]|uniref:HEAT repeat domain-containing protein n=1 Tax=Myxococcus dinghuensis TaxID=2906761 RepID=UPI0020A81519|nr:hypothetical protein [Myxococcus dinghuensis]MCP3104343.1 hypothetical protein [Myxococcus dinghuensis]